jgi:hypothetical protein
MDLEPPRHGCALHRGAANTESITAAVRAALTADATPTSVWQRRGPGALDESTATWGLRLAVRREARRVPFAVTVTCPGLSGPGTGAPHPVTAKGVYGFVAADWEDTAHLRRDTEQGRRR